MAAPADAVIALSPAPRERRWVSASSCVVDAVWRIMVRYRGLVVSGVAREFDVVDPSTGIDTRLDPDSIPLSRLRERFASVESCVR
ncbi:hypothetical protein [Nocardia testacea]|uniref:hypothetical protein n=1 Tax=Nocardia testacea TaxID=248551 RepID=UPI0033EF123E